MIGLTQRHELPGLTRALRDAPVVALDTEFHAERRYLPTILLLQVNVPGFGIHLLDPTDPEVIRPVAEALTTPAWIVHAGRQDLRILAPLLGRIPERVYDTQIAAGLLRARYPAGLGDLLETFLGLEVPRAATLSDWSRRPLSERQLAYARDDVDHLPALWQTLEERLKDRGRLDVALAACQSARDRAIAPPEMGELWRSLPASQSLDGAALAALQDLCSWREGRAIEANQPARSVLGDGLMVDLARRRPRSIGHILANRRFPRRVAQKLGDDLLAVLRGAEARPATSWPQVVGQQTDRARARDALAVLLDVAGAELGWARRLVVPDPSLDRIVLADDPQAEAREALKPWQLALAEAPLDDALNGSAVLRIQGARTAIQRFRAQPEKKITP